MAETAQIRDSLSTSAREVDGTKYYIAEIVQPSSGLSFRAFVPETFQIQIQNHWEPIFGGAEAGSTTVVGKAAQAAGVPVSLKYLTRRIWTGSEPLDFNFTFLLDTYSSTFGDVEKPIRDLAKMGTARRRGAFLFAPGPTMVSDANRIYLRIGKFIVVDSVIIHNIDITFHAVADRADGRYMSADINVHLSTNYTPDQEDIERLFINGQSGNNDLADSNKIPQAISDTLGNLENQIANASLTNIYNSIFPDNLLTSPPSTP